jgi:pre-rRNA-processing protein TSR3
MVIARIGRKIIRIVDNIYRMSQFLPTIILRHRKENVKKCSLRGLENTLRFITYPAKELPDLSEYVVLTPNAPLLTEAKGLFLVDGTWRYAATMIKNLPEGLTYRSLPPVFTTAYPRRQEEAHGLASIEALYLAYLITGQDPSHLLDNYHWKEEFLAQNASAITSIINSRTTNPIKK